MKSKIFFFAMILVSILCFYGCTKAFAQTGTQKNSGNSPVSIKYSYEDCKWYGYDKSGNLVYMKDIDGNEEEYDGAGKLIHKKKYDLARGAVGDYDRPRSDCSRCYEELLYDDNGNKIYERDLDGRERWFDSTGNEIRTNWNYDGYGAWFEYDRAGNMIHVKLDGYECWFECDIAGHVIHSNGSDGSESWWEYDSMGNKIHYKTCYKQYGENEKVYDCYEESWWDKTGNLIHEKAKGVGKSLDEYERWAKVEYDSHGNLVYYNLSGNETWYDKDGKLTHKKIGGDEEWYDSNGNVTHLVTREGDKLWYEYDKDGNLTYVKIDFGGDECSYEWYEYDGMGNKIHEKDSNGIERWYNNNGICIHIRDASGQDRIRDVKYSFTDKDSFVHVIEADGEERFYDVHGNIRCRMRDGYEGFYDASGKLIHGKNKDSEWWFEYDKYGKLTCKKNSDGREERYDSYGNLILKKHSNGNEERRIAEYDSKGNLIHLKKIDGDENWYDSNGKLTHKKTDSGGEEWYDSNGNVIHSKYSDGRYEVWIEYSKDGKRVHEKFNYDKDEYEVWYDYNKNGNLTYNKYKSVRDWGELWNESWYDENRKLTYEKDNYGTEKWYDANEKLTHEKNSDGLETWYEYDSYGNLILKKDSSGNVEERIVEYDSKGNLIHLKEKDVCEVLLNDNGNLVYIKGFNSPLDEAYYEYDNRNSNHRKNLLDGSDWYFKKNVKINVPHVVDYRGEPNGYEWKWKSVNLGDGWCKYDEEGRIISFEVQNYENQNYERADDILDYIHLSYDSNGRIQSYEYGIWEKDSFHSFQNIIMTYVEERYVYYNNGSLKENYTRYRDVCGGSVGYAYVIFDIYGHAVVHESKTLADNFVREYKDGEIVRSLDTGGFYEAYKDYSMGNLGNVKINEDYARERGIDITYY